MANPSIDEVLLEIETDHCLSQILMAEHDPDYDYWHQKFYTDLKCNPRPTEEMA